MMIFFVIFLLLPSGLRAQDYTKFIFNTFDDAADLRLIDDASVESGALRLTDQSQYLTGRALYNKPVRMKDRRTRNVCKSFSTTFVFSIVSSKTSDGASGMSFIMTSHNSAVGAFAMQYLGLLNLSSLGNPSNHLFAVEFDTQQTSEFQDIDGNHVGVDLNTLISFESQTAGFWIGDQFKDLALNDGNNIQAWIDYDDRREQLDVAVVRAGSPRPKKPLISLKNFNLSKIFEEEMYVGFAASTGSLLVQRHYVLAWSFSTNGAAPELNVSRLPSFRSHRKQARGLRAGILATVSVVTVLIFIGLIPWGRRRMQREDVAEWELEFWPHRFKYKDLYAATKGFRDEEELGCGGFGRVYKGVLPSDGHHVAVKCIFRENIEGMREFIAEISSLGRLQHRNLVQIKGYCRRGNQLFIVYDYMPNGSLDKMIHAQGNALLRWPERYRILKDVASGLLYLQEEWKHKVVHRDIKSSNVLLDSEFNARLSDFGLARLYEHNENPRTTQLVGTLGYIAPELIHTGRATPGTDVYSFGILLLEVASGREPIDHSVDDDERVLVDWVRGLFACGNIMAAADPKLGGEFDEEEMEKVLKLGLLCSNPLAEERLDVRQIVEILEGKTPMLDSFPSLVSYGTTSTGSMSSDFGSLGPSTAEAIGGR